MYKRTSLFDLEAALPRIRGRRPIRSKRTTPKAARRVREALPAAPRAYAWQVQSFDDGAPLRCEHDVEYTPVERVQLPSADSSRAVEPVAAGPTADVATASELAVEAFEDVDGPAEPQIDPPTMSGEEPELAEPAIEGTDTTDVERITRAATAASAGAYDVRKPAAFASQMDDVERDLAELTARLKSAPPTPQTPKAQAPPAVPAPAPSPALPGPDPEFVRRKALLDQMAGLSYATEFRLPSVQLAQVFSALDQKLDAETPPAVAPAPANGTAPALPSSEVLIKDLLGLMPPTERAAPNQPAVAKQPADHMPAAEKAADAARADNPAADNPAAVTPVAAPIADQPTPDTPVAAPADEPAADKPAPVAPAVVPPSVTAPTAAAPDTSKGRAV